jgi:peroxiredoxin
MADQRAYFEKFIEENTSNAVGALFAMSMVQSKPMEEAKELLGKFETNLPGHVYVAEMKEMLSTREKMEAGAEATKEGNVAPDFTLTSTDGKEVALSSYKGKYVLVDFWASWCGPCRKENPNVVKAYNAYNAKGFEVLSVSVDDNEAKWLEAIKEDGLTWTQVRDTDKSVGTQYNVKQIPTTILLDKEGVIIAKNLRGEALEQKLAELLN